MVIKRAHHIWLSQVANIPTAHLCLLLVLREVMGSYHPQNAVPDVSQRKTSLSLHMQGGYYMMISVRFSPEEQFHGQF